MSKNITTPWTFKDGRDYVLSLTVMEHPSLNTSLSIKLSDKITAEEWSCSYDSKYVENLTHRTGSYKPFHVFVSMLQSALLKKSESVALDLMNLNDLENIRSQKGSSSSTTLGSGSGGRMTNFKPNNGELNSSCFSSSDHIHAGNGLKDKLCQNNESGSSKKKYLIVAYIAEFDRVHYPIPLNHSGPPNLQVMQKNIFQLRSEVVILRNAKISLEEEVINLKQIHQHTENNDVKNYGEKGLALGLMGGAELSHKMRCRCPEEEDQVLIGELRLRIGVLEETLEETRADHLKIVEKLQAENNFLQQKLNSSGKYEERLEDEIYLLTHGSSVPPGRKSQPQIGCVTCKRKDEMKRKISLNLWNSGDNAAASRRGIKTNLANLVGRRRVGSPGISPLPIMRRSRSFSPSPSRKVSFDPTAYIREKKLKQDRMAQLRQNEILKLEKIKSELQIRARDSSTSSGDGNDNKLKSRTRSISRESRGSQRSSLVVGVGGRAVSRSPLSHGRTRSSNMIINRKLENAKEISERLSRERNRSLGRRGGLVFTKNHQSPTLSSKNKMNSQIPIRSLHAHVDNLVSQELPRLRRSTRRNEIDMAE